MSSARRVSSVLASAQTQSVREDTNRVDIARIADHYQLGSA